MKTTDTAALTDDELALIREEAATITDDWSERQLIAPTRKEADAKFVREILRLCATTPQTEGASEDGAAAQEPGEPRAWLVEWPSPDGSSETWFAVFVNERDALDCARKEGSHVTPLYAAPYAATTVAEGKTNDDARDAAAFRILCDLMTWDVDEANSATARWSLAFNSPYGLTETEDDLRQAVESWANDGEDEPAAASTGDQAEGKAE